MAQNFGWRHIFFASIAVAVVSLLLLRGTPEIESRAAHGFIDFRLFRNPTYAGATLSNFLLNSVAGTLLVSLQLVQRGGGLSAQQAGALTIGYAVAIIAFIRVGEKLLQRFGARKPMIWGCLVVGLAIVLLSPANLLLADYQRLAMLGYTLFGIGLAFYATPSTALSANPDSIAWMEGVITFSGLQDNLALREAAIVALMFNLLMVLVAILSIRLTLPKGPKGGPKQA